MTLLSKIKRLFRRNNRNNTNEENAVEKKSERKSSIDQGDGFSYVTVFLGCLGVTVAYFAFVHRQVSDRRQLLCDTPTCIT